MKVRDIMTTDVATATPESTLEDVAMMMRDEDAGAIPVLDGENLVGIITDRDIVLRCIAEGKDAVETTVEDVIRESPETIEPDEDVSEARNIMARLQIRRLPVVEDGRLVGMLSIGDIAVKSQGDVGTTLEEISEGVKQSGRAKKGSPGSGARPAGIQEKVRNLQLAAKKEKKTEPSGRKLNALAGEGQDRKGVTKQEKAEQQRLKKIAAKRSDSKSAKRRRAS